MFTASASRAGHRDYAKSRCEFSPDRFKNIFVAAWSKPIARRSSKRNNKRAKTRPQSHNLALLWLPETALRQHRSRWRHNQPKHPFLKLNRTIRLSLTHHRASTPSSRWGRHTSMDISPHRLAMCHSISLLFRNLARLAVILPTWLKETLPHLLIQVNIHTTELLMEFLLLAVRLRWTKTSLEVVLVPLDPELLLRSPSQT